MFETNPLYPNFADVRRRREAYYAGRPPRRGSRAVVTMVRDEAEFLPIWLRYYSQFFAAEDIFVLDHLTTDGSTHRTGFNRIPVVHEFADEQWFNDVITDLQHRLLHWYDIVLTCDVDEIIAPRPSRGDLGTYLERFDEDFVNCVGYEVLHRTDREPPFDHDRPVLQQRRHWYRNPLYDKPTLASVPMEWGLGRHRSADGRMSYDPDLYLIHLHRMDYDLCRRRHHRRRQLPWIESEQRAGLGRQFAMVDDDEFSQWFFHDSGVPDIPVDLQEIDPEWSEVI